MQALPPAGHERSHTLAMVVGLAAETKQFAQRLAGLPTRAIGLTKRAINASWSADLDTQLDYEAMLQTTAGQTNDHREGVAAFLEKRRPDFTGH